MNELKSPITLYVWPGQWGLPSFEPSCLATVLYLQLTIPGKFVLSECNNPDLSPSGQLPFLVHDQVAIYTFSSIVKYVNGLARPGQYDLDSPLTPSERSQKVAWISHVESHFGNLVYHSLYSSPANWDSVVHPALVGMYDMPHRYYVPARIRASYKDRLEAVGLWIPPPVDTGPKSFFKDKDGGEAGGSSPDTKQKFAQAFEREKVQGKAKDTLGIYARLLEGKQYVYQGRPTTLDVMLAAHTLLLITPPLPDILIKELFEEWYTTLADHAKRIQNLTLEGDRPSASLSSSRGSIWDLIPSRRITKATHRSSERTPEDAEYEKLTWGFFGLALGSVIAYLAIMGPPIRIVLQARDEGEDEEEEEEAVVDAREQLGELIEIE